MVGLPARNVVHQMGVLEFFDSLPDGCIQVVVTSPPYWGLRVYGTPATVWGGDGECEHEWGSEVVAKVKDSNRGDMEWTTGGPPGAKVLGIKPSQGAFCSKCGAWRGHYGLEPTIDLYVEHTVMWMRALRPKLRDDGTVWLNLGDSYSQASTHRGGNKAGPLDSKASLKSAKGAGLNLYDGLKPKDLVMMPARVALALQADGWWLRSDIVWAKPNPMPGSVTDRPTKAHEYVFLLSKAKHYFYDADAVREANSPATTAALLRAAEQPRTGKYKHNQARITSQESANRVWNDPEACRRIAAAGRNLRSVWCFPTQPYSGAHFATFPEALPRTCILAGSSAQACPACGGPWERVVESEIRGTPRNEQGAYAQMDGSDGTCHFLSKTKVHGTRISTTLGFRPTCSCYNDQYLQDFPQARAARKQYQHWVTGNWWKRVRKQPGRSHWPHEKQLVCDPFAGTATTGVVAVKHGRDFLGCDLMGGDRDFEKGPGGVEHHTANERLAAELRGESLAAHKLFEGKAEDGQGVLWGKGGAL